MSKNWNILITTKDALCIMYQLDNKTLEEVDTTVREVITREKGRVAPDSPIVIYDRTSKLTLPTLTASYYVVR